MWIGDAEADGLLDEVTKMHCFVVKRYLKEKWKIVCDYDALPQTFIDEVEEKYNVEWLNHDDMNTMIRGLGALAIHNLFGYDLELLVKLGYIEKYDLGPDNIDGSDVRLIDTLSMSRALHPDRFIPHGCPTKVYDPVNKKFRTVGPHGLQAWGYRVANMKPTVDDWRNQPLEVYVHRCIEDVIINELVMTELIKESQDIAIGDSTPPLGLPSGWKTALKINNKSDYLMEVQQRTGILVDQGAMENLIVRIDGMQEDLEKAVEPQLPRRELPPSQRPDFPAKPFNDDGQISSSGYSWLARLGYEINEEAKGIKVPTYPAKPFKQNGDISASGKKWLEAMEVSLEQPEEALKERIREGKGIVLVPPIIAPERLEEAKEALRNREMPDFTTEMKMSNQKDIKLYLFHKEGWQPTIWGTKDVSRDDRKQNRPEHEVRERLEAYYEEVKESPYRIYIYEELDINFDRGSKEKVIDKLMRKARYLVTTPKFKDEKGDLCPSLKMLKGDMAKEIVTWLSLRNRRSTIKTKDEKKNTGWLNNPRLKIDGRIGQGHAGPTNTNRYKHRDIVNLPKADPSVLLGWEMRANFIAPKGKKVLGYDGSNLEQFVAASYAYHYDNGDYADQLEGDAHTTLAEAYSKAAGRLVTRSDGKNITYACLGVDNTTVLTREGWKYYGDLKVGMDVLTHNTTTGMNEFAPIEGIPYFENQVVKKISNKNWEFEATGDHRWYGRTRRSPKKKPKYYEEGFFTTDQINSERNILRIAKAEGGDSPVTVNEAKIVSWLLADGYIKWSDKSDTTSSSFGKKKGVIAIITQSEKKYFEEIKELLEEEDALVNIYEKKGTDCWNFSVKPQYIRDLWDKMGVEWENKFKSDWSKVILGMSTKARQGFLDAFYDAEGWTDHKGVRIIAQNTGNILEAVRLCIYLLGYLPQQHDHGDGGVNGFKGNGTCKNLRISNQAHVTGQRLKVEEVRNTDVFCLTTRNGTFVAKQGNHITITGNCLYGAQAAKIGKMLGVAPAVAQGVIDAFWDTNYGLKELKLDLEEYWTATGKRYIRGIDGRKIFTRSKHSLVNALFQSCGSLIMFLSGCYMYDMLKRRGLLEKGVDRLAFVHDEFQYEVPDELIETVAVFEDEDEAKAYVDPQGRLLSNPHKINNQYEVYYCQVGELGNKSLQKAGEFFNMPLPFSASYDIGLNLAETH